MYHTAPPRGATTPPLLTVCYSRQAALVNDVTLDYAAKTRSWLGDGVDWSLAAGFSCLISEVAVATIIIVSCAGRSCRPFLAYVAADSTHPPPPPPARITLRCRDAPPLTSAPGWQRLSFFASSSPPWVPFPHHWEQSGALLTGPASSVHLRVVAMLMSSVVPTTTTTTSV